jgi:hypothetical protein
LQETNRLDAAVLNAAIFLTQLDVVVGPEFRVGHVVRVFAVVFAWQGQKLIKALSRGVIRTMFAYYVKLLQARFAL